MQGARGVGPGPRMLDLFREEMKAIFQSRIQVTRGGKKGGGGNNRCTGEKKREREGGRKALKAPAREGSES